MTKEPAALDASEVKNKPQNIAPAKALKKAFKVKDQDLLNRKLFEIQALLFIPSEVDEEYQRVQILRALELYESLEPADGAEGMLAMQMVGAHSAALECLRRAALPNQSFEGRDMALKHAHKMMTLYSQQLAALNKHRGKGQQKVTVEHVNVEPGGQAIVGNVETGSDRQASSQAPRTLKKSDEQTVDEIFDTGVEQKPAKVSDRK